MSGIAGLSAPEALAALTAQEDEVVLSRFDLAEAWRLGSMLVEASMAEGHGVGFDIRRPGFVIFRAALPGITPDQQVWIERKSALVLRMEKSSALVAAQHAAAGIDAGAMGWLGSEYAITGGSFPVRVRGVGVIAAVTASGLTSEEDHDLVVAGLRRLRDEQETR